MSKPKTENRTGRTCLSAHSQAQSEVVAFPFCVLGQQWIIAVKNTLGNGQRLMKSTIPAGHQSRIFMASSWNRDRAAWVGAGALEAPRLANWSGRTGGARHRLNLSIN